MILSAISGMIKRIVKPLTSDYSIQNRLFASSIVLITIIITSIYFLSQTLVSGLIIQRQSEFDGESFKQANKYIKSAFSTTEGYVNTLHKNRLFREILTDYLDKTNISSTYRYLNKLESSVNTYLVNSELIDNIIILGKNNTACNYSQNGIQFDTSFLDMDFNFKYYINYSSVLPDIDDKIYPFYYNLKDYRPFENIMDEKIHKIMNGKIIYTRTLRDESNSVEGIIIVVLNNSLISDILQMVKSDSNIYLTSRAGDIIWTSNKTHLPPYHELPDIPFGSRGSLRTAVNGVELLFSYDVLDPYNMQIISEIPVSSVLKKNEIIHFYTVLFSISCLILVLVTSLVFSRNTCKQLNYLAKQLSSTDSLVPSHIDVNKTAFLRSVPLRTKITVYFIITVIFPTILYISTITYLNYEIYKKNMIEHVFQTARQLKWNINYKIKNYDQISTQINFDENIQNLYDDINGSRSNLDKLQIDEMFLNKKIKNKECLVVYDTLDTYDIKIIGVVPVAEIASSVYIFTSYSIFILLVYILLILFISAFISLGITKPIKKLEGLMSEIREGNLNVNMDYKGQDEIAVLSESFNSMIDRLNRLILENYQSRLRESELLFLEKDAQLKALQQQINPHFLYNTLELIKWMAFKINANDIINMTTALGKFFRSTISGNDNLITFQDEIDQLQNYLYIQKIRFEDKFDIIWDIPPEVKKYKTIKLILQPIVENAIIHGIEGLKRGGLLNIRACSHENSVTFEIIDNGIGIGRQQLRELQKILSQEAAADSDRSSIGISNVYKRLKLYFGDKSSLEIHSEKGKGTTVRFSMPIIL